MFSLLDDVINIGLNIFGNKKKKQQAKQKNELIQQLATEQYLSDKEDLILKHNLQQKQNVDLLNKTISGSKANFAKNGLKTSQSADNAIKSIDDAGKELLNQQNKIFDLNLKKLQQAYQNKIATGNLNYKTEIENADFNLINQIYKQF